MNYPFGKILSFSPERFLSIKDNIVETKPIKGTRPRSDDPDVDNKNIQDEKYVVDQDLFTDKGFIKLSIGKKKHFKIIN